MTKEELIKIVMCHTEDDYDGDCILKAIDAYASTAKPNVSGELEEFMNDVEHMQKLYANGKYGLAEEWRDKLAERLDDIMRVGSTDR